MNGLHVSYQPSKLRVAGSIPAAPTMNESNEIEPPLRAEEPRIEQMPMNASDDYACAIRVQRINEHVQRSWNNRARDEQNRSSYRHNPLVTHAPRFL